MADIAILETQLAEARAALHQLQLGALQVAVEYDGRRVQFSPTSVGRLETYVKTLEDRIARATGDRSGRRRSLRVTF